MSENCAWSRARLALYLDDELPAAERAAIAAHLEGCEACRAAIENLRQVEALLREASDAGAGAEAEGAAERGFDGGPESGADGGPERGFEDWLADFRGRHDLEAARRLRAEEIAADHRAGRGEGALLSAEEVAARPLEPELLQGGGDTGGAVAAERARRPARGGGLSRLQRLLGPHPAWRWTGIATATAAAAIVIIAVLSREPDLHRQTLAPASTGETLAPADLPAAVDEVKKMRASEPSAAAVAVAEEPEHEGAPPRSAMLEAPARDAAASLAEESRESAREQAPVRSVEAQEVHEVHDAVSAAPDAGAAPPPESAPPLEAGEADASLPHRRGGRGLGFSTVTAGPTERATAAAADAQLEAAAPADSAAAGPEAWLREADALYAAWTGADRQAAEQALAAYRRVLAWIEPASSAKAGTQAAGSADSARRAEIPWTAERQRSIEERVRELESFLSRPR